MKRILLVGLTLAFAWFTPAVQADHFLKITISDEFIPVNGTTSVDVMIESSDGTPIDLFLYSLTFKIVPNTTSNTNTGSNNLSFSDPASTDYLSDPNYVFFGFSNSEMNGDAPIVTSDVTNQDTLLAGDQVEPSMNIVVTSLPKLLIRFELTSQLLPFAPGDQYFVVLDEAESFFADEAFNLQDFQANQGLITIQNSAVPEPATAAMILVGLPIVGICKRTRRRRLVA